MNRPTRSRSEASSWSSSEGLSPTSRSLLRSARIAPGGGALGPRPGARGAGRGQIFKLVERLYVLQPDCAFLTANLEGSDNGRGLRALERQRLRLHDMQRPAAEVAQNQGAHDGAIVDVQPFRRCHETAHVTRPSQHCCCEEEVGMQAGETADAVADAVSGRLRPGLCLGAQLMMADIRRVPDERGTASDPGQRQLRVIAD